MASKSIPMSNGKGFSLSIVDEWTAHDPFGNIKPSDIDPARVPQKTTSDKAVLRIPRHGYGSFRVLVRGKGAYRLSASLKGLEIDLYRAWYHRLPQPGNKPAIYCPDALIPVSGQKPFRLPDPDNRIPGQKVQEFWVDIYVPKYTRPGVYSGAVMLAAGALKVKLPVSVQVLAQTVPDIPCITMDNNSYGARWLAHFFPKAFTGTNRSGRLFWKKCIEFLHHYYRLFREHRTTLHNLGYNQSGGYEPIYGPVSTGQGRNLNLSGWEPFDLHYGPLLDGSAFRKAAPAMPGPRQPATPVWGVYTSINPEWPADYVHWNEPGYETEFARGVGQYNEHLREKGWTKSNIEFFFNHKKRYRWFEWDGDEAKFSRDDDQHLEMIRLWEKAIGKTPVKWVYRMDASWRMKDQFNKIGGHRNFWVCGGFVSWYPEELKKVMDRGETVWWYGGYPSVSAASSSVLELVYRTWGQGVNGFCAWSTLEPGRDPWFNCDGATTGILYPGERFGIPGPLPSIRLKMLRNGVQDIDLIDSSARAAGRLSVVRRAVVNSLPIKLWNKLPKVARELPPEDWDSINLSTEHEPIMEPAPLKPKWWGALRSRALKGKGKVR